MSSLSSPAVAGPTPGLAAARPLGRVRARAVPLLGAGSLLGLVTCSLAIVTIAAERPSFLVPVSRPGFLPGWMAGPLHGLWPGLTSDGTTLAWLASGLMLAMFAFYMVAVWAAPRLRARWTLGAILTLHAAFLLAPPLSYTDVFNYIDYGRMGVVHHLNPYVVLPVAEPHSDPAFALSNWHHLLSPYGPLFTLLSYALVPLGIVLSFWALKLLIGLASLVMLALVWRCAELLGRPPAAAVLLVAANPIVLVWGLGADHNDALMVLLVMVAVYLGISRARAAAAPEFGARSAVALVAAAFIKAPAALLLPIFVLAGESRRRFIRFGVLAAAAFGTAMIVAFGLHLPDLFIQSRLVTAIGIPNLIGLALCQGGETGLLHALFNVVVVLVVGGCSVWTWRRPERWLTATAVILLVLVVSLSWAAPWYVVWILPFVALTGSRRLRIAVIVLTAYFILAFMPSAVPLASDLGFRPAATPLGVRHTLQINALVR